MKELELDRDGVPRQIADQILEDLDQLDPYRGHFDVDLLADAVHHVVDGSSATLGTGLEQHRHIAAVGRGGEEAQLAAGPPGERLDAGIGAQDLLDPADQLIGLLERAAGRSPVIEDEAALVHVGHEAGADGAGEEHQQHGRAGREQQREHAVRLEALEGSLVDPRHGLERESESRLLLECLGPAAQPFAGEQRNQRHRDDQGEQHRERERQGERAEELAHHAFQEAERGEDDDGGQGRARDRREDLVGALADDRGDRLAGVQRQVALHVLHYHDGVVDDQSDRDRQAAERHEVEGIVKQR